MRRPSTSTAMGLWILSRIWRLRIAHLPSLGRCDLVRRAAIERLLAILPWAGVAGSAQTSERSSSCSGWWLQRQATPTKRPTSRIGVFYDDCLSIGSSALEPGTPVTIIRFNSQEDERFASGDTPERRVAARVVAKADLVDDCPSWIEDRSLRENSAELFLYALSSEIPGLLDSVEWGIGIVGISPGDEMPIDLDGNGIVDTFSK